MSVSFISVLFCFKGGLKLTYSPPPPTLDPPIGIMRFLWCILVI